MSDSRNGDGSIIWLNVAILVVLPLIALIGVPWYHLTVGISTSEIVAATIFWWLTGLGITAGYHRLFAHRGWKAPAPVRLLVALFGGAAAQNSVIAWAAAHRYHHNEVDTDGDPYNARRGFFFSHMGWVMQRGAHQDDFASASDLERDPICRWQHRNYLLVAFGVNILLCAAAALLTGRWLGMFLIAGVARVVVVQHFTFLINSAAHTWGTRPWSNASSARDNPILAFLTFGEGYHNFHHTFQMDYRNGTRWYQWDPSKWLIWTLSRVGLATDLRRTPVDVMMRARFEQGRADFAERIDRWGQGKLDEWRARFKLAQDELAHAAAERREEWSRKAEAFEGEWRSRVVEAERRMEEALAELKRRREAMAQHARNLAEVKGNQARRAAKRELRDLERAVREAQRAAQANLRQWNGVVAAYTQQFAPQQA